MSNNPIITQILTRSSRIGIVFNPNPVIWGIFGPNVCISIYWYWNKIKTPEIQ